jgi:hypothetical protein
MLAMGGEPLLPQFLPQRRVLKQQVVNIRTGAGLAMAGCRIQASHAPIGHGSRSGRRDRLPLLLDVSAPGGSFAVVSGYIPGMAITFLVLLGFVIVGVVAYGAGKLHCTLEHFDDELHQRRSDLAR